MPSDVLVIFHFMRRAGKVSSGQKKEAVMPEDTREFQELFRELNGYEKKGVYIELEGKPASPTQIVQAHMLREDSGYMRDYVLNEKGDLKALYFHHIAREN